MKIQYFAAVPYPEVTVALDSMSDSEMNLEIEVLDPHWILQVCELPMVRKLGNTLKNKGICVNVQGPFLDLAPGSLDPFIREHTRNLFLRTLEIAGSLQAEYLTLYSGYNPLLHSGVIDQWMEVCLPLWRETAEVAERYDITVLIANLFEEEPGIQLRIIEGCEDLPCGACFDLAHAFIHSKKKLSTWVNALAKNLKMAYLNDAKGRRDEHLALGAGRVPFKDFYKSCLKKSVEPAIVFKMPLAQGLQSLKTVHKLGLGQYQMELL
jgi:sugar phosphate isomerase/epimerase